MGDSAGRDGCVLGSGNNLVEFDLAGMAAPVTSADISQVQLDTAACRAAELGPAITFVRADVVALEPPAAKTFDLVYTRGHIALWVSDLATYHAEACRILKRSGIFMVNEYHLISPITSDSQPSTHPSLDILIFFPLLLSLRHASDQE